MSSEQRQAGDCAVVVREVSKSYRIFRRPQDRLKQVFMWGRRNLFHEFRALDGISFEVRRGEAVGVIGPNGAGKSSILQIIAGTTQPTAGEVHVHGRVAALLELGSGFNPEFTGRENVLMNATILGLTSQQIRDRYDEIVAFADIGDFIDQPVKVYSTGMAVRLAFAVAVHVDADLLIVDEALSVGDLQFQAKCIAKINQFLRDPRKSLLFVSHSVDAVKAICRKTLLLHHGRQLAFGPSEQVCDQYMAMLRQSDDGAGLAGRGPGAAGGPADGDGGSLPAQPRAHEWQFDLGSLQADWQTLGSGPLAPGRYRVKFTTGRSKLGGEVELRRLTVRRHREQPSIPLAAVRTSPGWQLLHARTDHESCHSVRHGEELEFEFTGHELLFEAHRHSRAGSVRLVLTPIPAPVREQPPAASIYRASPDFTRRVSGLRAGSQQARFTNVEILNHDGEPGELIPSGEELLVRLHMTTDVDLPYCNAGCIIRDENGRDLLTINTFDEQVNWEAWKAGTPRVINVRFRADLRPGNYTVAAGISHSVPVTAPDAEVIFDFCPNAAAFRILAERSGRPCWGIVRLPAEIEVVN